MLGLVTSSNLIQIYIFWELVGVYLMRQNMGHLEVKHALMGGLTKYMPITKTSFLIGTLSLCGIPPLACFWSKDEILSDSWVYSPIFAIIAYFTTGLTAFYMFQIKTERNQQEVLFINSEKKQKSYFFSKKAYSIDRNVKKGTQPLITFTHFKNKENNPYPYESENTMGTKRGLWDKIVNVIYNWSYNCGYTDSFYATTLNTGIRRLVGFTNFFDRRVINGITNEVGITSLFVGKGIKNVGGGRISSYLFFYSFFY
ncbi:hypothetical protein MKX03_025022 [Papaver bracteatum]|nr:hypothetical protein MKX03_025022 [Papaver bracteatum]